MPRHPTRQTAHGRSVSRRHRNRHRHYGRADVGHPDQLRRTRRSRPTRPRPPRRHAHRRIDDAAADGRSPTSPARRRNGSIATDILAVMRADPDATFKVSHLSTALPGTSAGAIANSLHKLVIDGSITQVCEKPATYQAA